MEFVEKGKELISRLNCNNKVLDQAFVCNKVQMFKEDLDRFKEQQQDQ